MTTINFELVIPTEENTRLVFNWRNDPVTRKMSRDQEPKDWELFCVEFSRRYYSMSGLPPLFILNGGKRVGVIFFEPSPSGEKCCQISINIAPEERGEGIATQSLLSVQPWLLRQGISRVYATIRNENSGSIHCFRSAGYTPERQDDQFVYYVFKLENPEPSRVRIIAEAGSNWYDPSGGSYQAKKLVEVAAEAGCDAVKFQVFRSETTYVPNAQSADYLKEKSDINTLFDELAMPYEMIEELASFCKECGIAFKASAFSLEDFKAVLPYIHAAKIASYEITHPHLIKAAAESRMHTYLSTGGANLDDIDWAVDLFFNSGGSALTLMQCTAHYPAPSDAMQLRAIPFLGQRYRLPVGLSDHSRDPILAPVGAVALGASAIEKHFTLDNDLPGPDHRFSILPGELKQMVKAIRETELMVGATGKWIDPIEKDLRSFAQRRIQAISHIEAGEVFEEGKNIAILRSGKQRAGVHPRFLDEIIGSKASRSIELGDGIRQGDWE